MKIKGPLSEVTVDDSGIHIHYRVMTGKGDKTIPFSQVVAVQVKKRGVVSNGYIYFQTIGSTGTGNKRYSRGRDIEKDDNTVIFNGLFSSKKNYETALQIRDYITKKQNSIYQQQVQQMAPSSSDEILKLKQLLDMGAITNEEFEAKKKQLLNL